MGRTFMACKRSTVRDRYPPQIQPLDRKALYKSAGFGLTLSCLFVVGTASLLLLGCGQSADSSATAAHSPAVSSTATPLADVAGFRVIPADSIPNSAIDAHIPRGADVADRKFVRAVMKVLMPSRRQYVVWMHVPPGKYGYDNLPNHGLMVMYCGRCPIVNDRSASDFYGNYVLYFDGKVQPDSNANSGGPGLDKYLIFGMSRFNVSDKYP
jgi:hypothetical protein